MMHEKESRPNRPGLFLFPTDRNNASRSSEAIQGTLISLRVSYLWRRALKAKWFSGFLCLWLVGMSSWLASPTEAQENEQRLGVTYVMCPQDVNEPAASCEEHVVISLAPTARQVGTANVVGEQIATDESGVVWFDVTGLSGSTVVVNAGTGGNIGIRCYSGDNEVRSRIVPGYHANIMFDVDIPASGDVNCTHYSFFSPHYDLLTDDSGSATGADPAPQGTVTLSSTSAAVNATVTYAIEAFPADSDVTVTWQRPGGSTLIVGRVMTDNVGSASGSFKVPATEGGNHNRVIFAAGAAGVTLPFQVTPRIKVIPAEVSAGDEVDASLRGFVKGESVEIRWLVDGVWVPIATVSVSNTGSANLTVTVPANAGEGLNSVRGDGVWLRAQTNAVTVVPAD